MALQTAQSPDQNTTLAQLQSYVTQAESHGGGWVYGGVCRHEQDDRPVLLGGRGRSRRAAEVAADRARLDRADGGVDQPGDEFVVPAWVSTPLAATGGDAGSGITKVVFRDGSSTLRTDTSAPYSWSWSTSSSTGAHILTAVATDAAGNTLTSASVTVNLTGRQG